MDDIFVQKIQKILNEELIRRLLRKYFSTKGLSEDMEKPIYPPIIQDLMTLVPQFSGKIEVVPSIENIEPDGGELTVEWNMFVLGTNRMYLGESTHKSLTEVGEAAIATSERKEASVRKATPNRIIEFVTRMLSKSKSGMIDKEADSTTLAPQSPDKFQGKATSYGGSQGFEQNKPVL